MAGIFNWGKMTGAVYVSPDGKPKGMGVAAGVGRRVGEVGGVGRKKRNRGWSAGDDQFGDEEGGGAIQPEIEMTQLIMEHISTLKEKGNKLSEEKEELKKQVLATAEGNDVDEGGGVNDHATNQINSPKLTTLPLFNG